eukprot:494189-Amphidinium_carterae.1
MDCFVVPLGFGGLSHVAEMQRFVPDCWQGIASARHCTHCSSAPGSQPYLCQRSTTCLIQNRRS